MSFISLKFRLTHSFLFSFRSRRATTWSALSTMTTATVTSLLRSRKSDDAFYCMGIDSTSILASTRIAFDHRGSPCSFDLRWSSKSGFLELYDLSEPSSINKSSSNVLFHFLFMRVPRRACCHVVKSLCCLRRTTCHLNLPRFIGNTA
jgi:hypothetical protein